jgi:hypothetical protein
MSPGIDRGRRAAVLLGMFALIAPAVVHAQDPRAAEAQLAAREWLADADRLDAQATWNAAGRRFQKAMTVQRWSVALNRERKARGAVEQRAVAGTAFRTSLPPAVTEGDFAIVLFRTSFAQRSLGSEQVTLEREADGVWRVIGYLIR